MSVQGYAWERSLLARATEAFNSPILHNRLRTDPSTLGSAYRHCAVVTKVGSRTFYLAANLLPQNKRRAVHALYAFCRTTDDLVDEAGAAAESREAFANWRRRLLCPRANDPIPLAWADTQARYGIPRGYAEQLINGIARDLVQTRYSTFTDLAEYCYGVASTVGLMVMHIIGFQASSALPYAIKLGVALQLTNILRDVGEDWRAGRLYLPLDELAAFGLTEADVSAGHVDDRWRAFMHFQIDRIRTLYREAEPGLAFLAPDGRLAIGAAATLYRAIVDDIEAHDCDVFHRRAHIGLWGKLKRLPAIWWQTLRLSQPLSLQFSESETKQNV
jgi:phytoene synthase